MPGPSPGLQVQVMRHMTQGPPCLARPPQLCCGDVAPTTNLCGDTEGVGVVATTLYYSYTSRLSRVPLLVCGKPVALPPTSVSCDLHALLAKKHFLSKWRASHVMWVQQPAHFSSNIQNLFGHFVFKKMRSVLIEN